MSPFNYTHLYLVLIQFQIYLQRLRKVYDSGGQTYLISNFLQGIPSSHAFDSHGLATHDFFEGFVDMGLISSMGLITQQERHQVGAIAPKILEIFLCEPDSSEVVQNLVTLLPLAPQIMNPKAASVHYLVLTNFSSQEFYISQNSVRREESLYFTL